MNAKDFVLAMVKFFCGVVIMGLLLFVPAGSFKFFEAWLLLGILFFAMPLVLGSIISFAIMLFYIPIIAARIKNEEKVLEEGLEGYADYKKKIRFKVIPFIWLHDVPVVDFPPLRPKMTLFAVSLEGEPLM